MTKKIDIEKFHPACPWHIRVGDYFIAPGKIPNAGLVYVGKIDGSAGAEFHTSELEPFIRRFFEGD